MIMKYEIQMFDDKIIALLKFTGPSEYWLTTLWLSTNIRCPLPNVTYLTAKFKSLSKFPNISSADNVVNLACNIFFTNFILQYALSLTSCALVAHGSVRASI